MSGGFAADPLPPDFAEALAPFPATLAPIGRSVLFFRSIGSTNDVAVAQALADDGEGTIVIADEQTAGRGRRGHTWHSPAGAGLYVSVVLRPSRAANLSRTTGLITLAAGVALSEAVQEMTGLAPAIKWPNDLHLGTRKLAGILAETAGRDSAAVVLGYGINVGTRAFPGELQTRATSLESELGRRVDRAAVLMATLTAISRRYRDLLDGRFDAILDAWRARSPSSRGARVTWPVPSGTKSGLTDGIDDHGALLVRVGDQVERIVGGELIWTDWPTG